jgi:hypothetical protein
MSDTPPARETTGPPVPRRPYIPPRLEELGKLQTVTLDSHTFGGDL